jgi:pteridine reductase
MIQSLYGGDGLDKMLGIFGLQGKVALVTGAAKRLGRAVALGLAEKGARIIIHYHSSAGEAEETAGLIRKTGGKVWTVEADLAKSEECQRLFTQAGKTAGRIDILVNSASIFPRQSLLDFRAEDLTANIQVNAMAPLILSRQLARQAKEGVIINFLDTHITGYQKGHAAYHLSKRLLFSLTRMMALEFAPAIRVNAVAPGLILPPEGEDENYLKTHAQENPLKAHGRAEDVTQAVIFLLQSSFITGQVIFVDGGFHMKGNTYGLC